MSKIVFIPGFVATVTTIVIDNTPIIGGASGRILFQNAANQISESVNFTYLAGIFNVTKTATHQAQFTFDANNYFRIKATSVGAIELSATGTAPKFLFNADVDAQTNKVYAAGIGVGTITPAAILEVLGTTQQARFSYDASNRLGVTVASNGTTTFALTGTAPVNIFSQAIGIGVSPKTVGTNTKLAILSASTADYLFSIESQGVDCYNRFKSTAGIAEFGIYQTALYFQAQIGLTSGIYFYDNSSTTVPSLNSKGGKVGIGTGLNGTLSARLHVISTTEQVRVGYNSTNYSSFTVGSTGSLTIGLTGTTPRTTFSQGISVLGTIKLNGYTVATLPAGVIGETAYVTDALAPIFLGIIAGGGAVVTPVFYNGANWIAQ